MSKIISPANQPAELLPKCPRCGGKTAAKTWKSVLMDWQSSRLFLRCLNTECQLDSPQFPTIDGATAWWTQDWNIHPVQPAAVEGDIERETYRLTMLRVIELGKEVEFMECFFNGGSATIDPNGNLICITNSQIDKMCATPTPDSIALPVRYDDKSEILKDANEHHLADWLESTEKAEEIVTALNTHAQLIERVASLEKENLAMREFVADVCKADRTNYMAIEDLQRYADRLLGQALNAKGETNE